MSEQKFEQGMKIRREVLGDAHVDRAEANKTEFDADFQRFITETAWGAVWSVPVWRWICTLRRGKTVAAPNQ